MSTVMSHSSRSKPSRRSSSTSNQNQSKRLSDVNVSSAGLKDVSNTGSSAGDEVDLVLPTKVFKAKKTSVNNLSQGACSYLWFRRIKEIFLVMGKQHDAFTSFDMDLARTDMIQTCDQYLESERPKIGGSNLNKADQAKIDRWKNKRLYAETFRMSYFRKEGDTEEKTVKTLIQTELSGGEVPNFDNAIWWYSCNEAPIFDQMNNILRLESFELLMCHRYYISDLCQMIERWYTQNKFPQKFLVYRADRLSRADFAALLATKEQKDATISINGFISTSRDEKISLEYAEMKLQNPGDDVIIMYEVTIDPTIPCTAYADIESISFHPREREILFNMGSTFQIDGIADDPNNAKIKRIRLTARDFNLGLVDEMRAKLKQASQATLCILLVRYLIELGEDRVSKRYLNQILDSKQLENDTALVSVYNCLGTIYLRQAMYGKALDYYRKALNTQARLQFSNNNALAEIFNNIGQTHLGLNQLDEAQQNLEEAIRIQKREPKHAQQHLALLHCNLGQVAYARHDYDEAEQNFQLSDDLYNRNTKSSHDALEKRLLKADLCVAYGHLKSVRNRKDPTEASTKFQDALQIYESILPPSHPKVTKTHIDIVCEYARNKNFQSVIDYYDEQFIDMIKDYETRQTTSQQDLANLFAIIGACFAHEKRFDEAMEIWKKSIEHEQKSYLDQLLSSARISKIDLPLRLVETAYCAALGHYSKITDASLEYLGILYKAAYLYDQAVDCLRRKNLYLVADIYVLQGKFEESMEMYKRILKIKEYDLTCAVRILLEILTGKKTTSSDEAINQLIQTDELTKKGTGNEIIHLRMIINDYLAESYLLRKQYEDAIRHSRVSFDLKQRHYATNHPSLVQNFQFLASSHLQRGDYKSALQYFEKAVEIQLDNMPSGHKDIRSNYFLMGDCYCLMDRLELAEEFYDRAQTSSDNDTDDNNEAERDIPALIRMHSNLAKACAKQNDIASARKEQNLKIDLLQASLPTLVVDLIEDENASTITVDSLQTILINRLGLTNRKTFAQFLNNIVFVCSSIARALLHTDLRTEDNDDSIDYYQRAIELELKLTMFEKANKKCLPHLYEELSNAYAKLYSSMKDSIQENLMKALDETTDAHHQRSLEFRLGNLCFEEKNYFEADHFWRSALEKVQDNEIIIKEILKKSIEKNKDNLRNVEEDSDDDDDDDNCDSEKNDEDLENNRTNSPVPSVKSQRRDSVKSTNEKEKPEDLANAYLDLEDDETELKYFKKYVTKLENLIKHSVSRTTINDKQVPMIEFYHLLLLKTINSTTSTLTNPDELQNKDAWINLLQAYIKMFSAAIRLSNSSSEIAKTNLAVYQISQKLYNLPDNLIKVYDLLFKGDMKSFQWEELINLLPQEESTDILMRIAAYYISNENNDEALEIYCTLQNNIQNDEILKSAVNYSMLKLFNLNMDADEQYGTNIIEIDIHSPKIPLFDRILLCQAIIEFWEELEDEKTVDQFKKELINLQSEPWTIGELESTVCIGQILTKVRDCALGSSYWCDVETIYKKTLSNSVYNLMFSTDSTFEQILRATQEVKDNLLQNTIVLAESFELLATYEVGDDSGADANDSRDIANTIRKKISATQNDVTSL